MPDVAGPSSTDPSSPGPRAGVGGPAGPGRRPLFAGAARTLLTTSGVVAAYFVLPLDRRFSTGTLVALGAGVLVVGVLVAWQVRWIMRSPHPALRAVEAASLSLPLFLLIFAAAYQVLSASDAGAFTEPLSRIDSLYFVITAFATVGFGDIAPVSQLGRVLVTVQMIGDLLLIGLVLRLFVAAVDRSRHRPGGERENGNGSTTPGG